ncbi:MAG: hypothetical protein ACLQU1_15590 [Bryobacteraceae bacterium]
MRRSDFTGRLWAAQQDPLAFRPGDHLARPLRGQRIRQPLARIFVLLPGEALPFVEQLLEGDGVIRQLCGSSARAYPFSKRILGIIPNYRTSPSLANYQPLTAKGKFKIAAEDSFDPGTFVITGIIAGEAQLAHSTPSFGQEESGYARYFGATYGNLAIGSFMREAIYPSLLHQDPRYFRRGTGSARSRVGYAVSQIFWTHTDSGGSMFNFSEVLGSATSAAISDAYYPAGVLPPTSPPSWAFNWASAPPETF